METDSMNQNIIETFYPRQVQFCNLTGLYYLSPAWRGYIFNEGGR